MRKLILSAYSRLPVPVQDIAFSAWGIYSARQRYASSFRERLAWLDESQWWSADQIAVYQDQQIAKMVKHAYATVPIYRRLMDGAGVSPKDVRCRDDLPKLPIVTKQQLRAGLPDFVSRDYSIRSLRRNMTSGTTGTPLVIYLTAEAQQFQWAVWWRHRARFGLHLGDKFLTFGARLPVVRSSPDAPIWRTNRAINQTYLSTYHLTDSTMRSVLDWLNTKEFAFFAGYPSAMYVLASYVRRSGLELVNRPRHIVSGSDALIPAFERTLADVFHAPVTDQYGSAEACGNFARCELGAYHLDAEFGYVELLPVEQDNDPRRRRLVFTGFANPAMPLIRFDIGDYGLVGDQVCPCGRESLTLNRIEGRTEDYIRTPDGRMAIGMNQALEWAPNLLEAQIRQDSVDSIDVLVVPDSGYGKKDEDTLTRELRYRLGDEMTIRFHLVDQIPRTESGKFRAVVSTLVGTTQEEESLKKSVNTAFYE